MNAIEFEPLPELPARAAAGHKGTFGTVLVIGGCAHGPRQMLGGAMLAARGALRAGAGRVVAAVPEPLAHEALMVLPEATVVPLPTDGSGVLRPSAAAEAIDTALPEAGALVIGPALGPSAEAGQMVMRLLAMEGKPMVVDADAIRHFASHADAALDLRATTVFTPHPGEAAVLAESLALDIDCIERATRPSAAMMLAQRLGAVVVLKGAGTVTSDGLRCWRCDAGNAALATGGSGDVLAGIAGGLLAQFARSGPEPVAGLAALAVELHARAGDLWRDRHGDAGALAHELADLVPDVLGAMRRA